MHPFCGPFLKIYRAWPLNSRGITPAEKAVAEALQTYGAYVIDKGGAPSPSGFELAPDATSSKSPGSAYVQAGLAWDYFAMPHIPWRHLRVLRRWDGG